MKYFLLYAAEAPQYSSRRSIPGCALTRRSGPIRRQRSSVLRYLDMYPEFTITPEHREAFAKTRSGAVAGQRLVDRFG